MKHYRRVRDELEKFVGTLPAVLSGFELWLLSLIAPSHQSLTYF